VTRGKLAIIVAGIIIVPILVVGGFWGVLYVRQLTDRHTSNCRSYLDSQPEAKLAPPGVAVSNYTSREGVTDEFLDHNYQPPRSEWSYMAAAANANAYLNFYKDYLSKHGWHLSHTVPSGFGPPFAHTFTKGSAVFSVQAGGLTNLQSDGEQVDMLASYTLNDPLSPSICH
jgi:hypothetical protein